LHEHTASTGKTQLNPLLPAAKTTSLALHWRERRVCQRHFCCSAKDSFQLRDNNKELGTRPS